MLPRVQPIAPVRRREPFDDPKWLFDLKYDGFRGLCYLSQGRCRMVSRNGNLMSRFARLGSGCDIASTLSAARHLAQAGVAIIQTSLTKGTEDGPAT